MPKRPRTALLVLILVFAYVLIFPGPTGTEPLLQRRWVSSLDGDASGGEGNGAEEGGTQRQEEPDESSAARIMPFRLGERFGYFSSDGEILFSEEIRYGLAQSREYFANYSVVSENTVLQSNDGSLVRSIGAPGYPYVAQDRLFIFAPNGSSVSEWTTDGELLWEREFLSVLTDLAAGDTHTAVALLNGEVQLLDEQGETTFSHRAEGPRLEVALSVAAGSDENAFAALVGADPQQLIVFERHSEGFFPALQLELDTDYRRSVLLEFLAGGDVLVLEQPDGMLMYDRSDDEVTHIDLGGPVRALDTISDFDMVVSVSGAGPTDGGISEDDGAGETESRRLHAMLGADGTLISESLSGQEVFLRTEGSRIYLGTRGMLACIELVDG